MTDTTPAKATNLIAMYKAAIGEKNQAYYLEKFSKFDEKGGGFHPSWNWGAFIGTFVWALYRKMYGLVFTCLIFIIVFAVAKQVSMVKDYVVFMELALALCFPIFGNALYYRKIKAKVKKAIDSTTDEQYAIQRLNRNSGVHIWVLYSALVFCVVIVAHILWRVYASKNDVSKIDVPIAIESVKTEAVNSEKINDLSKSEVSSIEKYQQALRINPEDSFAWHNLGRVYYDIKQHPQAIYAYQQAIRIDPKFADAWGKLGSVYYDTKQYQKAIDAHLESMRIDPKNADAWLTLGDTYLGANQYLEAINAYQQALRIEPEFAKGWYDLGYAYYGAGNRAKVTEVYEKLRALDAAMAEKFFREFILPKG